MLTRLKETFDNSSYGELYRYIDGWVRYGNPAQAYPQLIYLMQGFTDICNQHGIEYWLDWGSLLGYLRHDGGVIPWDYDHDVGMVTKEFERFIAIIEDLKSKEAAQPASDASSADASSSSSSSSPSSSAPVAPSKASSSSSSSSASTSPNSNCTFVLSDFTFERNGERGYYVMSLASHPEIQIDIVEYITEKDAATGRETLKHNMDDVTYEGFFYPDYPVDMVFPLKKVNMLGCPVLIPRDSDAVTKSHFGDSYMKVLWVPYLLTKLYNPFLTSTLWKPPVREIPIAPSYIEGFKLYGATSPFIVRKPKEFAHITLESIVNFTQSSQATVFGYDNLGEIHDGLLIKDLVNQWQKDELQYKVLDSPLPVCQLPADFVALDEKLTGENADTTSSDNRNEANAGLGLMLTRANAYTFLHLDPPFYGGGWMYLVEGRKSWTYIPPEHADLLYDPATKRLTDLPISELTTRFGHKLHGQVLHMTAEAGDLVYFPPCWMHRVRTYEKCIGISGYMKVKQAHANIDKWSSWLAKKGLNSIWNGNEDI